MPSFDVTLELDGVDVLDHAFLDRVPAGAERLTLGRGERQWGVVELDAADADAAVATATTRLRALDPQLQVVLRRVDQRVV